VASIYQKLGPRYWSLILLGRQEECSESRDNGQSQHAKPRELCQRRQPLRLPVLHHSPGRAQRTLYSGDVHPLDPDFLAWLALRCMWAMDGALARRPSLLVQTPPMPPAGSHALEDNPICESGSGLLGDGEVGRSGAR
jgi:hypothetical protein